MDSIIFSKTTWILYNSVQYAIEKYLKTLGLMKFRDILI